MRDGRGSIAEAALEEGELFAQGSIVGTERDSSAEEFAGVGFLVFEEEDHAEGGEDFGVAIETMDESRKAAVAALDQFRGAIALADFNRGETKGALPLEGRTGVAPDAELGGGIFGGVGTGLDAVIGEGGVATVRSRAAGHVAGGALGGRGRMGSGERGVAGAAGRCDVDGLAVRGMTGAAPELAGGLARAFAQGELFDVADDAEILTGTIVDDGEGTDAGFAGEVAALTDGVARGRGETDGVGDVGTRGAGEVGGGVAVALVAGDGLGVAGVAVRVAIETLRGDAAIEVEAGMTFVAGGGGPELVVTVEGSWGLEERLAKAHEETGGVRAGADAVGDGVFRGELATLDAVPEAAVAREGLHDGAGGGVDEGAGGEGRGGSNGIAHGSADEGGDLRGVAGLTRVGREERESDENDRGAQKHAMTIISVCDRQTGMRRREFLAVIPTGMAMAQFGEMGAPAKYEANWDSLKRHPLPKWFGDAKLGIFIHWGLYSVPAWAQPSGELGKVDWSKWFYQNPYAEWYLNSIRLKESSAYAHHAKTYGADYDYYRFAATFTKESQKWNPDEWAGLFKDVGARYVVLTTKHHDGFTLWPSKVKNPVKADLPTIGRDLVGDLTGAVRKAGMKMGLYYSGGLDWTFEARPVRTMMDVRTTVVQTQQYADYADAHWYELMDRYQPAVLWNDIGYPRVGKLEKIFADFYNRDKEGLINNRFGRDHFDFTTPEYSRYDTIVEKKWESCRGLGFSFGYNQIEGPEHVLASDKLVELFVDIVSKNGNLLLNIGPKPDGSISAIQQDRLKALGTWLKVHGEGLFDSKPWVRAAAREADADVRFTRKGDAVYAYLLKPTTGNELRVPRVMVAEGTKVTKLGEAGTLEWRQAGPDLIVKTQHRGPMAGALKITPAPYQLVRD